MISFILHHSGLELSSDKKILNHPAIQNDSIRRRKDPNKILLDLAIHHSAINGQQRGQRGRPDIVHMCILEYLFSMRSLGNKTDIDEKLIKFFVHTNQNLVLEIPIDWRIPVSYIRFRGLMEELLYRRELKTKTKIPLKMKETSLADLIKSCQPARIIQFTSAGTPVKSEFFSSLIPQIKLLSNPWVILIGGYQQGFIDLPKEIYPEPELFSIFPVPVPAWKVIGFLLDWMVGNVGNYFK